MLAVVLVLVLSRGIGVDCNWIGLNLLPSPLSRRLGARKWRLSLYSYMFARLPWRFRC